MTTLNRTVVLEIKGPTGSGKTLVLNAIEIFLANKGAKIVHRNENEIEVTYEIKNFT